MICNALEHVAQIRFWIQLVEFGSTNQPIDACSALTSRIGTCEKMIFASTVGRRNSASPENARTRVK
jgi:hypothetical protein